MSSLSILFARPGALDLDTQLMMCVQAGDAASFSSLLERNRSVVVHYLSRMVRNHSVAEDLAQDVFFRVYRSRAAWKPDAKFTTWLYRIATNVALNHLRDERRSRHDVSLDAREHGTAGRAAPDHRPLVEQEMLREALAGQVRHAIRCLPPKQRAAVIMHKYEELDYAAIAQILGSTTSAVKALIFRAYQTLRIRLRHLDRP